MKRYLIIIVFSLHSCLDFGEVNNYDVDSKEAFEYFNYITSTDLKENIKKLHVYSDHTGIDPFSFAKFKTTQEFIDTIAKRNSMEIDTSLVSSPNHAPTWFNPDTAIKHIIYYKKFTGGSLSMFFNTKQRQGYFARFTH